MKSFLALAAHGAVEGVRLRQHKRTGSELRKQIEKDNERIAGLSPRVLASCSMVNENDYNMMDVFMFDDGEQKSFFNDKTEETPANVVNGLNFTPASDVKITAGNGFCDKGVYKSWNKCNINGKCFVDCEDGLCHQQHLANQTEQIITVPNDCRKWYKQCAKECANSDKCVAFSFLDTNILGHAEYTCHLMDKLTCKHGTQTQYDPRSSFHVKGDHIQALFDQYEVDSKSDLDAALATDTDFLYGHWESWGYHNCKRSDGKTCGEGTQRRKRVTGPGQTETETRACDFRTDDGELIVCENIVDEDEAGHGWMHWQEWSHCSKSCNATGKRQRVRVCSTCANVSGLCSEDELVNKTQADYVAPGGDYNDNCPKNGQIVTESCDQGKCLPSGNGNFNGNSFKNKKGWALDPNRNVVTTDDNYLGRCSDLETAYLKINLPMNSNGNAFGECMRICQQDEQNSCLAVSFFPRTGTEHGVNLFFGLANDQEYYNCFLFDHRCHQNVTTFTNDFEMTSPTDQSNHKAWYAFKDLCSGSKMCDNWGTYMITSCDSSGSHAFPAAPKCTCPGSADHNSKLRLFGNAVGIDYFDFSSGNFGLRKNYPEAHQRSLLYSEKKFNNNFEAATGMGYQESYQNDVIGCHDPCAHNQCVSSAVCQRNMTSVYGYDCVCQWPTVADPSVYGEDKTKSTGEAGYSWENGCLAPDFRNTPSDFIDNMILYGGGWNSQKDPEDNKVIKPYYGYYGLEATDSPWKFKVVHASQKIPAPDRTKHKGKFYNCMMNIQDNEVMVVGGRPGQFFDKWDDKTFVYSWPKSASSIQDNGKWIGITGAKMDETVDGCKAYGDEGCQREHDWPDLPSTPLFGCKGQCRNGTSGAGPTEPHWIHEYCMVSGSFYNKDDDEWQDQSFNLCRYQMVQDSNGVKVDGLNGKWSTTPMSNDEYESNWLTYIGLLKETVKFYRGRLASDDIGELDQHVESLVNSIMKTGYDRWKMRLDNNLYSPVIGPVHHSGVTQVYNYLSKSNYIPSFMKPSKREFYAPGQPICGVMGPRAYIGSGSFARLLSLPVTKSQVKKERVWRIEPESHFPEPYKRANNERCMQQTAWNTAKEPTKFDLMPEYRQNFGTVTTTEGMWMMGGLISASADLAGRLLNRKYNIAGCTKQGHFDDVWVFNPRGWNRERVLGEAVDDYVNQSEADILSTRRGYSLESNTQSDQPQTFADFRLSDDETISPVTIERAIEEGWECTGVQGKWCRKPFLPRNTKGAESLVMCFEPVDGETEPVKAFRPNDERMIPRRPRVCTVDETNDESNNCICYIINVSGQSGLKQADGGSGFRPEIDYLEVRRADGTWGSDKAAYATVLDEYCPDATEPYPDIDPAFETGPEAAVDDYTECTTECTTNDDDGSELPTCNRSWAKRNLRRRWHEAGRIKHPRMGFLAGTLKGEIVVWGGECFGPTQIRQWNLDGTLRMSRMADQPRSCKIMMKNVNGAVDTNNDDYIEVFSFIRMNQAGFLFGERRFVELDGYYAGRAGHGEAAVSQAYSSMNTNADNFQ